jgi:thiol:disulfide interchange protein
MPCVLPVIGLKVLSFAEQAGQSRMQVLALNLWYSLGVLVVFWVLAGMAVFLNLAWGEQFQAIWFNVLMTGVVFAMGLSFLGVWEIPVPGFATTDKASDLADSEGALGAFFKGILTTVLSTPCSGPLLGAVFSYLVTQEPIVSFLVFTCIGLGMASPYILVGLEPSLIRFIPKPGEWMNTFKHVMGFVMMGAAVLLFASVAKDYRIATLTFLVGLSASCWLIGKIPAGSEWPETIQGWSYATALSILIGLVSFGFLGPNEFELPWQPWKPGQAETLAKSGKTVLVDFTADWCQTCKFNLKWAINTRAVQEAVKEKGVVPLLADWTEPSEEIKSTLLRLDNSRSIPLLAIYPAGKPEQVIILRDLVTQAAILEALEKAGPSQKQDNPEASAVARSEGGRTE